jgi:hypothetical protein
MKSKFTVLITVLLICISVNLSAQTDSATVSDSVIKTNIVTATPAKHIKTANRLPQIPRLNLMKINLATLFFKSYSLQYERILNRKFSVALQYRVMPETGLPFKRSILKLVDNEDPESKKTIDEFKISNYAITPEVRIYLSRKGFGRGFYIAPFYRYASFASNNFDIFFTDQNNAEQSIKMSGKLTANTFGLAMGVQSALGKHLVLDIGFFGPHYGSGKGEFKGTPSHPLSAAEQNGLRNQLEGIDIPLTNNTVEVNANSASLKLDGPWGGMRFTLGLGVRF